MSFWATMFTIRQISNQFFHEQSHFGSKLLQGEKIPILNLFSEKKWTSIVRAESQALAHFTHWGLQTLIFFAFLSRKHNSAKRKIWNDRIFDHKQYIETDGESTTYNVSDLEKKRFLMINFILIPPHKLFKTIFFFFQLYVSDYHSLTPWFL